MNLQVPQETLDLVNSIDENINESVEHRAEIENSFLDIRNLLLEFIENSEKESKYQHRVNLALLIIGLLTLLATIFVPLLS